jgi:hypothetical protein
MLFSVQLFEGLSKCLRASDLKTPPKFIEYALFMGKTTQLISDGQFAVVIGGEAPLGPSKPDSVYMPVDPKTIKEREIYRPGAITAMHVLDSERIPECGLPDSIMRVLKDTYTDTSWAGTETIESPNMTELKSLQHVLDTQLWSSALTLAHEPSWKFIITSLDRVEKSFNPKRNKSYNQPPMYVSLHTNPFWQERSQHLIKVSYGHATGILLCQVYNG